MLMLICLSDATVFCGVEVFLGLKTESGICLSGLSLLIPLSIRLCLTVWIKVSIWPGVGLLALEITCSLVLIGWQKSIFEFRTDTFLSVWNFSRISVGGPHLSVLINCLESCQRW